MEMSVNSTDEERVTCQCLWLGGFTPCSQKAKSEQVLILNPLLILLRFNIVKYIMT